ncbi:MAG: hypothetical protein LBT33_09310 [Spirochaetia bacterium]|jgi:hypothetical protein|nr:hypothetical protein [Spirochaetia bacterium]
MGLLKRLLQERGEGGLLKRALTLKNYELEADGGEVKKKAPGPPTRKPSPIPKKR